MSTFSAVAGIVFLVSALVAFLTSVTGRRAANGCVSLSLITGIVFVISLIVGWVT